MTDPILDAAVERLEPCPFCDAEGEVRRAHDEFGRPRVVIACRACDGRSSVMLYDHQAIAAWNRRASNARALAAEEALRPLADDPAVAALMDCQYRAGALAGWNAAHHADPEEGEKIMARIRSVEPGSLSPIVERNLARTTLASMISIPGMAGSDGQAAQVPASTGRPE